ncbi:MAG TPA: VOC family protein [Solirubrobacteraceae bacterium]|nr:VOC family protein [Solirubrobacteraceae bacterium]
MEARQNAELVGRGLLGRSLEISQIAVVVHDLEKTMEQYTKLLGWGPWNVYRHEPPRLHDTVVRGEQTDYTMLGAETHVGDMGFELLQPLEGPSIYKDWLEQHGEGLHHIAVMLHDFDESTHLKERFAEVGAQVLMGGRIGETIEFYYLNTEPTLKLILESGSGHAIDLVPDYVYPS